MGTFIFVDIEQKDVQIEMIKDGSKVFKSPLEVAGIPTPPKDKSEKAQTAHQVKVCKKVSKKIDQLMKKKFVFHGYSIHFRSFKA